MGMTRVSCDRTCVAMVSFCERVVVSNIMSLLFFLVMIANELYIVLYCFHVEFVTFAAGPALGDVMQFG